MAPRTTRSDRDNEGVAAGGRVAQQQDSSPWRARARADTPDETVLLLATSRSSALAVPSRPAQLHARRGDASASSVRAGALVEPEPSSPAGLLDLPNGVLWAVLGHLGARSLCRVACACRCLREEVDDPTLPAWANIEAVECTQVPRRGQPSGGQPSGPNGELEGIVWTWVDNHLSACDNRPESDDSPGAERLDCVPAAVVGGRRRAGRGFSPPELRALHRRCRSVRHFGGMRGVELSERRVPAVERYFGGSDGILRGRDWFVALCEASIAWRDTVTLLDLDGCTLTRAALATALGGFPRLDTLNLTGAVFEREHGRPESAFCEAREHRVLRYAALSGEAHIRGLLAVAPNLEVLDDSRHPSPKSLIARLWRTRPQLPSQTLLREVEEAGVGCFLVSEQHFHSELPANRVVNLISKDRVHRRHIRELRGHAEPLFVDEHLFPVFGGDAVVWF